MIRGIELTLGGTVYTVPPLSLGSLERLQERITAFTGAVDSQQISTVIDAATAALKRNYPALERVDVAELIDVADMVDVMEAVMDVSGVKRKSIEAEKKAAASNP